VTRPVLVVGGSGGFGRRLVQGLIANSDFTVIVAGRDRRRAESIAAAFPSGRISAVSLDTATVTAEQLRRLGAFAMVDAAGPYQGADYRLARAAIAAGMNYVDLADARDFVAGFGALDADARAAGVVALTGASSTPALSNAVLDRMIAGWQRIDRVEIAISPGNRANPRGLSVIRSILSYAGKPVRVFDGSKWTTRPGWGMLTRRDMPGLGRRFLSLCETPDLDIVPARFAPREAVLFRAGLELSVTHLGLWAASLAVRLGILRNLLPFTRVFQWAAELLATLGTDRGGMSVGASGLDAGGNPVRGMWSLVAERGKGPFIPTLPALAALRAIAAGRLQPGARACAGVLDLTAIEREFAPYPIATEMEVTRTPPPFQQLLGAGFAMLPGPVRKLHSLSQEMVTAGRAEIVTSRSPLAWLLCRVAGLPQPGNDVPVTVTFRPRGESGEFWQRCFVDRRYASTMQVGSGADCGLLVERFWPFVYYHRLTPNSEGVAWTLVEWKLLGVPLPHWTVPDISCFEGAEGERYTFDIDVVFPLAGPVIHYRGWLLPAADQSAC
jgi:hypothetical protein